MLQSPSSRVQHQAVVVEQSPFLSKLDPVDQPVDDGHEDDVGHFPPTEPELFSLRNLSIIFLPRNMVAVKIVGTITPLQLTHTGTHQIAAERDGPRTRLLS